MYIRKFQTNLLYISHIPAYIPRYIYSQPHIYIEKPDKRDVIVFDEVYNPVPKTKLKMETYHPPSWEYDINLDALLKILSQVSQDEMKSTIATFLKDREQYQINVTKSDRIKIILEFLGPDLGKTYNQTDIAKRLGAHRSLITKIKDEISI